MIYTFTGTGNSLWIAREIGKELSEEVQDILSLKENGDVTCEDAIIGFVFPTYMGDIPWIVKAFLLRLTVPEDAYIFLIMDSNNGESRHSFLSFDQTLRKSNARLSAAYDVQMPGNCIISSEKENLRRLEAAPERIAKITKQLAAHCVNYKSDGSTPESGFVEKSYFYGEHSLRRLTLMKNFQVAKKCNGCGICADICPTGNISVKNGKAVHANTCAACYRCLHWCPKNATLLNVPTLKHRSQYHHPKVTVKDIQN